MSLAEPEHQAIPAEVKVVAVRRKAECDPQDIEEDPQAADDPAIAQISEMLLSNPSWPLSRLLKDREG